MLLEGRSGRWILGFAAGWNSEREGIGQVEADEGFGGDLDLLTAGDGVGSGTYAASGSGSDGCAFAAAEYATENCAHGCSASDFFCGIGAAAFALDAVRFGVDGEFIAAAIDAGEFDGEQRTALVMGGFLNGDDAAGDRCAGTDDDDAIGDDVGGDGAGEGLTLLCGGAVEGLGDANGNRGSRVESDVTEGGL